MYMQLKAIIASQIQRGDLGSHEKLPSERELARAYGISRMTVRHALNSMVREGQLYTEPGRGVFVSDPRLALDVRVSLAGFSEDIVRSGSVPSSIVIEAGLIRATEYLAGILRTPEGAELVKLERLRMVNGVPVALHTAHLPHSLCPGILERDLAAESLMHILGKRYGLELARAEQTVRATLADFRERQLLNLPDPSPVLGVERTTYLDTGEVVEFAHGVYCGEWYRLQFELDPNGQRPRT
jgi:GntR family transcriptional regulator